MSDKIEATSGGKQIRCEQDFKMLAENTPDMIAQFDKELRHIYVNSAVERATGLSRDSFIGKTNIELEMPENHVRLWNKALRTVFETGKENTIEFNFLTPGGQRYFESRLVPESAKDGSVESVLVISRDITERRRVEEELRRACSELEIHIEERTSELEDATKKLQEETSELEEANVELEEANVELEATIADQKRTEETLRRAEERYRLIFEHNLAGIFRAVLNTYTLKGRRIDCNDAYALILGYSSRQELLDKPTARIFFSEAEWEEYINLLVEKKSLTSYELRLRRKDGSPVRVLLNVSLHEGEKDSESLIEGTMIDITRLRLAEEQIREQAMLLDKAQDAIIVRDLEQRIIFWNKGAAGLYGWTQEEATGRNTDELLYTKESKYLGEAKKSIIEKGRWTGDLRQRTKDGREITVESRWTLVYDYEGRLKSILIINTDITEKKRLERQLLRAQRMESIGTLAGGIAHDLNNVLTPIMLSLQMLRAKLNDEQSQKLLMILEKNSQRAADLIKQVLSFARGVEGERNVLQIKHIITEIEKIAKETFPRNIEIRTNMSKDLWTISGDATQLHQVIMNLCVNSRDAMPYGGILSIFAKNISITEKYAQMNIEAKAGSYIVISVSDTGTGISPEILDRIFEPFFTTKEHGKGTGLGLSTSLAIVKSHGGFIDVNSKVGEGTTFKVYLPAFKAEIQEAEIQQLDLPTGNGESILVAEDEDSIREVTISMLETHGYKVLTANDGAEAVALYAENMDKIKLILMDMMMPVMDGHTSIRGIRRINPEVKIIAVSGLTEKDRLENVTGGQVQAFLPKPYTAEILLKSIHKVLSAE